MKKTKRTVGFLTLLAVVAFAIHTAQAVLITVDGVDWLYSGFEGQAPGELLPGEPEVNGWDIDGSAINSLVVDEAIAGFAPYEGEQFLSMTNPDGDDRGHFARFQTITETAGATVEMEFAFRLEDTGGGLIRGGFAIGGGTGPDIRINDDGSISTRDDVGQGPGGSNLGIVALNATHNVGEWNTLWLQWVAGDDTGLISINDSAPEIAYTRTSGTLINNLYFSANAVGTVAYVDAIPEPSTLALLGLGALMLGRRRRF